jgi:hypothetical protein
MRCYATLFPRADVKLKTNIMKRIITLPVFCLIASFFLSSCVKDELTRTYSIYTPIYKSKAEVAANMKTNGARAISQAGKFFLYGRYLLINEVDKGIHIIDNINPSSPKSVGFIDIPGNVDMAVKNDILYADFYRDLVTIDFRDPLNATVKHVVKNAFPPRAFINNNGFVIDTTKVVVGWNKKDTTVSIDENIQTMGCPNCMGGIVQFAADRNAAGRAPAAIAGSMARFSIVNNYLYAVDQMQLNAFSLAKSEEPVLANKVFVGWGIETIFPFKDKLFIGSNFGMFIYDISNGAAPQRLSQFSHAEVCDPVIADDNYAFVTLRSATNCRNRTTNMNQLDVLDITNLTAPFLVKTYPLGSPQGLSKDGNLLFIGEGNDGLKVFDASNVMDLKLIKHFKGFDGFDVIAHNKVAMVVGKSSLRQFDYSNPADIKYLSAINW